MILSTLSLLLSTSAAVSASASAPAPASAEPLSARQTLSGSNVCPQIASSIIGKVYYPLSANYISDASHYFASSSQSPMCTVEVASAQDVSAVLKIVGSTRTPFGVKSGGHSSNQGFSSTTGVLISLAKYKQVKLSADKQTVEIGLGNLWSDVYTALNGTGVNVVGGRVPGPGTGGFTLGGGYSWLTDQYGLTCDTTVSYELILPNGTITTVDAGTPDLFFALKGGLNRFGVVTQIVYRTFPQPDLVYGGARFYSTSALPALINATAAFQDQNTDRKTQLILTINGGLEGGAILLLFHDGPEEPAALAGFRSIPGLLVDGVKAQTYADFEASIPADLTYGERGAYATLMTTGLTPGFLRAVANESAYYGALSLVDSATILSYDVEPFMRDYGSFATDSAFPHDRSPLPLNVYYGWALEADDVHWRGVMQQSVNHLTDVAKAEGIYDPLAYAYPNYALATYTGEQVYGPVNAARLRAIRDRIDPDRVMELAGGFSL